VLSVDPDNVAGRIDEKIYGHFLEHIFHSVNGGLWGEMIWDRSFEGGATPEPQWSIDHDVLVQNSLGTNVRLLFGDLNWKDYEFTLEAEKVGGEEGFLVLFRAAADDHFYWLNLGGWGNIRHSLERGSKGQERWGTVGPRVDGKIEQDRWYRIRIRCAGPEIDVYLDDEKIIQFTDEAGRHLSGRVGVGTWATKARFRNLRVASLDGKTLYEGLPQIRSAPATAHSWRAYGPGKVYSTSEGPLNCDLCKVIESQSPRTNLLNPAGASPGGRPLPPTGHNLIEAEQIGAGLEQTPLNLQKGQTYYGSLWARGSASEGLVVRLLDGDKTLARKVLSKPTENWQSFAFKLKPNTTAQDATIQVGVRGEGRVCIDQVSLMSSASNKTGGFRPDLLRAVADLNPPIIRWPGGCFASAYRWKDGVGPQHKRVKYPRSLWDDVDINSFGTDEFIRMCRAVGAEPLIVVNIGTQEWNGQGRRDAFIQEVKDWIEYCNGPADSAWGKVRAGNGHPKPYGVKYWEIDNETWHMGAEQYAEWVRIFAQAMRQVDPGIKLAACGSGGYGDGANGLAWNRIIIDRCAQMIDYLSIHHYENPSNFAQGPRRYEDFFRRTGELIARSGNPRLKIYVSEWNAQSTDWRTGLYCGGLLNAFERCGDTVEMGGPALFLRHNSAKAWGNAFINFDHRTWFPAPNYVVMKLWREHYAPFRVQTDGDSGSLNGSASKTANGAKLYYKVVNPAQEPVSVELNVKGGFPIRSAGMQLISVDSLEARNTLDEPNRIRPVAAEAKTDGQSIRFTMPGFSAAVVSINRR
jgi:alpha-N-arabinofuranosidase